MTRSASSSGQRALAEPGPGPGGLAAPEHTSLDQRLGALQLVRAAVVVLVLAASAVAPAQLGLTLGQVLPLSLAYLAACAVGQVVDVVRLGAGQEEGPRRRASSFRQMLLPVDSFYLGALTVPSGGAQSDFIWLFAVQLIAVTLLASPRTGVRLAMCDTALLLAITALRLGAPLGRLLGASQVYIPSVGEIVVRTAGFWAVVGCTAYFSALSERELRRSNGQLDALSAMASEMEVAMEAGCGADGVEAVLLRRVLAPFGFRRAVVLWGGRSRVVVARAALGDVPTAPAGADPGADRRSPAAQPEADGPGPRAEVLRAEAQVLECPLARRALGANQPLLLKGLSGPGDAALGTLLPGATNVVVVPLRAGHERQGLLLAESGPPLRRRVSRRSLEMLTRFAAHTALALSNADLRKEVDKLAASDSLTWLANRRALMTALSREVARSARTGEPVSLAVMDIDFFKRVNDTLGHLAGDEVLKEVAAAMSASVREFDVVARYGGEEFAVVLPNCPAENALAVVERVRAAASSGQSATRVTLSAGIATAAGPGTDGERLLAAADAALYASKEAGRDRATLAPAVVVRPRPVVTA